MKLILAVFGIAAILVAVWLILWVVASRQGNRKDSKS